MQDILRAQAISMAEMELESQNGPIKRQVLTFVVAPLFQGTEPESARRIDVVLDASQLHRLRHALLELDLPETSSMPPRPVQ
jgi:hypothetical protein